MSPLTDSIDRARSTRQEALELSPRAFGAWASRLQNEAVARSIEISGGYSELNRWMVVANRHELTYVDGLLIAIENMRLPTMLPRQAGLSK